MKSYWKLSITYIIYSNDLIDWILPKVSRWRSRPCPALHKLAKLEAGNQEARLLAKNPWTRSHSPSFWEQLNWEVFVSFDDFMVWHPLFIFLLRGSIVWSSHLRRKVCSNFKVSSHLHCRVGWCCPYSCCLNLKKLLDEIIWTSWPNFSSLN